MPEIIILIIFAAGLLASIILNLSILYALLFGYILFFAYGIVKKHSPSELFKMSLTGIGTIKNMLLIFLLIGMMTAVWRACGTIPFIIYYASRLIIPSAFLIMTFLLCSLISLLTGTAFGTAATAGLICMTVSGVMGLSPVLTGGAVLSGSFFGDRCSPMSTSALLVSELTGTDIYKNIKNMIKTAAVPFAVTAAVYYILGRNSSACADGGVWNVFREGFNLHWTVIIPAVLIVVLALLRVKVKYAMAASVVTGIIICLTVQKTAPPELLRLLIFGYSAKNKALAAMINGGGMMSMVSVAAIVCLSSSYSGLFDGTGMLEGIGKRLEKLSHRITPYGTLTVTSVITSMAACNQTLAIMLSNQLCGSEFDDKEELALGLEDTVVVIAPLIPWSIAGAVPLATVGAPDTAILAAVYLYLIVIWNLSIKLKKKKKYRKVSRTEAVK